MLNAQSQWHTSGLLSTAYESMTLPSRLKTKRETLDHLTNALNTNGNQNIAKLRMTIDQKTASNGHHRPGRLSVQNELRDVRVPSQDRSMAGELIEHDEDLPVFDMDFFSNDGIDQSRRRNHGTKKAHVFGQAEAYRGDEELTIQDAFEADDGQERARRRAAGLPVIHK